MEICIFIFNKESKISGALKIFNASAGSGKTYTLVREYLRIILHDKDPKKFRRILAMTFTNKAANEMKERILQKLIQLSKASAEMTDEDRKELQSFSEELNLPKEIITKNAADSLNAILHNYGMFSVMTLDKFTHRVIRTFAKELGLSLDFDVELDLESLRKNVADLLFDKIGRDAEITKLMVSYADSNLKDDKSWNFKRSLVDFSKKLFQEDALKAIKKLSAMNTADFLEAKENLLKDRYAFEAELKRNAQEALDLIASKSLTMDDFVRKSTSVVAFFTRIAAGNSDHKSKPSKTLIDNELEGKWAHPSSPNIPAVNEIEPLIAKYFLRIKEMFTTEYGRYALNLELLKIINNLSLMKHLLLITEEIKKEENVLLISDFYKKISEIISNEPVPFIYERLGVRYEHFLLDEFQDTSHLQWVNLVPLIHNSLAVQNMNLIVGDGKQAIYRWRNGEVEQFISLPDKIYNPDEVKSLNEAKSTFKNEGEPLYLEDNYRSAPEIVSFNNGYFKWLADQQDEYIQKIYAKSDQNPTKKHEGYVEFFIPEDKERSVQLDYVHGVVHRSLEQGYRKDDICVLVRRNHEGSDIARHLTSNGVQVVSQDSLFVSKDLTVRFVFNLIKAFANPNNNNYKKKCVEHFDQLFSKKSHLFELLDEDFNLAEWLAERGYKVVENEQFHSFYEYAEHLIEIFDFDLSTNTYLQFFLEQIHLFEKRKSNNVHAFIEAFNEKGHKESIKSPEGSEAVNIMTIHKAKGLQFPIVICAFFDWDRNANKSEKWMTDTGERLPAFPLRPSNNTKLTEHKTDMEREEVMHHLDQLNMIYVALTRAEVALFVSGSPKKRGALTKEWIKPYLDESSIAGNMTLVDEKYALGSFGPSALESRIEINSYEGKFLKQHMNKPELSTKNGDQWDIHDLDKKRLYGTQLHLFLSKLSGKDEIDEVLESLLVKGSLREEFQHQLRLDAIRLFEDTRFSSYFEGNEILNEQLIVDELGKQHIPDKIIINDGSILIVDFKSGEPHLTNHKNQLQEYVELLAQIRNEPIQAELFYTEDLSIVPL